MKYLSLYQKVSDRNLLFWLSVFLTFIFFCTVLLHSVWGTHMELVIEVLG